MKQFLFINLLAVVCSFSLPAQTLSHHADGMPTDFTFTFANRPFSIESQQLIKRAVVEFDADGDYAYNSYHLEFATTESYLSVKPKIIGATFLLTFYDENDRLLLRKAMDFKSVDARSETVWEMNFYSLNLIDLPFTLLDLTKRIDIMVR